MRLKAKKPTGLVVFSAALLLSGLAVPAVADEKTDRDLLVKLAQQYLLDRATRVTSDYAPVSRAEPSTLTSAKATEKFSARTAAESSELDRLRATFANTLTEYSHAEVTIEHADADVGAETAELELTETTDLYLAARERSADVPEATSYRLGHTLRFDRSGGAWRLSADVLNIPRNALDPIPYVDAEKSGAAAGQGKSSSPIPAGMVGSTLEKSRTSRKPRASAAPPTAQAAFNRQAAVNYALRWALDRNLLQYNQYGNDCANFVSQILRNGGWTDVGSMNEPEGLDKWWINYPSYYPVESRTFRISHELALFGYYYSRRLRGYANEPARLADAIFADWDDRNGNPGTDGHLDHSMFITHLSDAWNWEGIYVSYHTTDTRNISMAAVDQKVRGRGNPNFGGVYYFMDTR